MAEQLGADLREQYYQEERQRRALLADLDELKAQEPPPPDDPTLLEELPHIPVTLVGIPENLQRDLFAAFALVVHYDRLRNEVQLSVTLTDTLAGAVAPAPDSDGGVPEGAVILPFPPRSLPQPPLPGGREKRDAGRNVLRTSD